MPQSFLPPLDYAQSALTGWTRAHWEALLARVTWGFARRAGLSGSPARVLYPDDCAGQPDAVDGLEAFSRLALIWGAWLRNPANPSTLTFAGRAVDIADLLARGLREGTDPAAPATYWGDIGHMDQRIVECANLSLAVWLSRERVLFHLPAREQVRVLSWLAQVDGKGTYPDNWVMFPALSQAVRLRLGWTASELDLRARLEQMSAFYRGDGWYVDGPADEFDLYNAWMFGCHYLFWAWIDGDRFPDLRDEILRRARSFLAGFVHFFGANGVFVPWGRSLGSRFGGLAAFALGHLLGIAPGEPGQLRRLSSGCLRYFVQRGLFQPGDDHFTQGFHGHNPRALESYVSPASPHSALAGLLALTFDPADPFWTTPEVSLPVEQADFELVLPEPGFVVSGRQSTGQVLLLNSRAGHVPDVARHDYTPKYGKLAYSTHFPFNVVAARGGYALDAMLSLTSDGCRFGHRVLTRHSGAAPGFIWCQFDQDVDGAPQSVWAAVALWGDIQLVLAVVRPTVPVRVFHAPGALGCEQPSDLQRRSDREQGWEYAEAGGRALGLRRLLGYDDQAASAPFLGDSTLNLAYPYAEQPFVCERAAALAARSLASVALLRPGGFDPAEVFAGFQVSAGSDDSFRVQGPDGAQAVISLASQPPDHLVAADVTFDGVGLRCVRLLPDRRGCSGLGVSAASGIVTFERPAVFKLARAEPGDGHPGRRVHLTTNAGALLDQAWLAGAIRRIEARALDGAWVEAGRVDACRLPGALVRAWQARSERQMIEFRLSIE